MQRPTARRRACTWNADSLSVTKRVNTGMRASRFPQHLECADENSVKKDQEMQNRKRRILLWLGLISIFPYMAGCAMMDKSECLHANWHEIGRMDGLQGHNIFQSRANACSKHGVGADGTAYVHGLQSSLPAFCTAASGRAYGENGGIYTRGFCPANTESQFLSGYTPAHAKFKFQQRIRSLRSAIADKNQSLNVQLRNNPRNNGMIEALKNEIKTLNQELQTEMFMRVLD